MKKTTDLNKVASDARADRLKSWIDSRYPSQQAFIDEFDLNQGEISNILKKNRVLGERKARKLEQQTNMPIMYLDGLIDVYQSQSMGTMIQSQGGEWQSQNQQNQHSKPLSELIETLKALDSKNELSSELINTLKSMVGIATSSNKDK